MSFAARAAGWSGLVAACGAIASGCGTAAVDVPSSAPRSQVLRPATPPAGRTARASYAPWPSFGHDAQHSGSAPVDGPTSGAVRWRRRLEGPVVPGPVVDRGGVAYAASNGGVLHAIDIRNGRDRWKFDGGSTYGSDLSTSPLITPSGLVIWPGPDDAVVALTPAGRVAWKVGLDSPGLSPALAPDGSIVLGDTSGTLRALAPPGATGTPATRWKLDLGSTSYGSPAIAADGTVYTTVDTDLIAVRDGRMLWRVSAGDISEVSPAIAPDGTIVFAANDDVVYGVRPDGTVRWKHDLGALTYSSPTATRDGLVYIGDHRGFVTALSAATGKPVLRVLGLGRTSALRSVGVWAQPIVDARHNVYFGTRPGHVYGFDVRGRRLFDIDAGATVDSYPALAADGTLLVGRERRIGVDGRPRVDVEEPVAADVEPVDVSGPRSEVDVVPRVDDRLRPDADRAQRAAAPEPQDA